MWRRLLLDLWLVCLSMLTLTLLKSMKTTIIVFLFMKKLWRLNEGKEFVERNHEIWFPWSSFYFSFLSKSFVRQSCTSTSPEKIRFHAHERVSAIIFKLTTKMRQFILVKQHHKSARRDVSEMFFLSHSFFHTFLWNLWVSSCLCVLS